MEDFTICWISQTESFYTSVRDGKLVKYTTGGLEYNFGAYSVLKDHFDIRVDESFERRRKESVLRYATRVMSKRCPGDLVVKEPMVFTMGPSFASAIQVGMLHHIDFLRKKRRMRDRAYLAIMERRLKRLDHVVTVSQYWHDYVMGIGAKGSSVIHNSYDPRVFERDTESIAAFRKEHGLEGDKPVIYLGKGTVEKGFFRALKQLDPKDYHILATGKPIAGTPDYVKVLSLSKDDYITMLHAADAVVTLPQFPEGWSRVVHESLLCKTPVIGVESGGMTELLMNSGQYILREDALLPVALKEVLSDRAALGARGYDYVKQFDLEYFRRSWIDLIEKLKSQRA